MELRKILHSKKKADLQCDVSGFLPNKVRSDSFGLEGHPLSFERHDCCNLLLYINLEDVKSVSTNTVINVVSI